MGKHTPGPWVVHSRPDGSEHGHHVTTSGGLTVCAVNYQLPTSEAGVVVERERIANARLIAAAPELLEALRPFAEFERVRSLLGGNSPKEGTLWGVHTSGGEAEITVEQMRAAMAAIAKATGETP